MLKPLPRDLPDPHDDLHAPTINAELEATGLVFACTLEGKETALTREAETIIAKQIRQHLATHQTIGLLAKEHAKHPERLADAYSLLREQVERVFVVTRVVVEPAIWAMMFARDDVARTIRYEMAMAVEREHLPRQAAYYGEVLQQHLSKMAQVVGLTPEQVERLTFEGRHPSDPIPSSLKGHHVERFPTPKTVHTDFRESGHPAASMLGRWRVEYGKYSGHTHLGGEKMLYGQPLTPETKGAEHQRRIVEDQAIREVHIVSWLALLSTLTEVLESTRRGLRPSREAELVHRLSAGWDLIRSTSLVAMALWELRAKEVLPPS